MKALKIIVFVGWLTMKVHRKYWKRNGEKGIFTSDYT